MHLANFRLIFILKLCFELIRLKNGIYASDISSKENKLSKKNEASKPLTECIDPTSFEGSQSSTISDVYLSNPIFKSRANRALREQNEELLAHMPHGASTYDELIMNGGIFIDKTMLIKYLLDYDTKVYLITAPRRWGKTINLRMIQYFFEAPKKKDCSDLLPLNESIPSYQLFYNKQIVDIFEETRLLENRLLISEEKEIMEKHFGKHPVIHLDLMALEVYRSFEPIISEIKRRIQTIFKEHLYVAIFMENEMKLSSGYKESNIKEDLDKYLKFLDGEASNDEYIESIEFLCDLLNTYTTLEKPIILFDEVDSPLLHVILSEKWNRENEQMLIEWFSSFLTRTFKKQSTGFTFAVLTGCIRIVEQKLYSGINNFKHYSFLNAQDIFFFYGFHQDEVDEIMKLSDIPDKEYRRIRRFYNGYIGGDKYSLIIYNPFSIANYIRDRRLMSYWTDTGTVSKLLQLILYHDKGQEKLMNSIAGEPIHVERALELTHDDLNIIREMLMKQNITNDEKQFFKRMDIILKMMFSAGYLTVTLKNKVKPYQSIETLYLKAPNEEIKTHLLRYLEDDNVASFLKEYSPNIAVEVGSFQRDYIDFKTHLKQFLLTNTTVSDDVCFACENLLQRAPPYQKEELRLYLFKKAFALYGNEAMSRIIFDHTIIFEFIVKEYLFNIAGVEKTFTFLGKQYRIDLVIIYQDSDYNLHGTIIKYKFMPTKFNKTNQKSDHALAQCLNYTSYFLNEQLDVITVKCVGISIQENKHVSIDSYFMDSNNYAIYSKELKTILQEYVEVEREHQKNLRKKDKSKEKLKSDFADTTLTYNTRYLKLLNSTFHSEGSINIVQV